MVHIICSAHTQTNSTHTQQAITVRPPYLHLSPDTPQPGRVGFHGGGMLHHLVHCHHQEDDIDLSKETHQDLQTALRIASD